MAIETTVQLDKKQERKIARSLAGIKKGLPRVNSWAIRQTISQSRKRMVRGITGEIAITQKKLYQRGSRRRPVHERLVRRGGNVVGGRVTIDKGRLPLGRFTPRQHWKNVSLGLRRGSGGRFESDGKSRVRSRVSYKISKSGGRKKLRNAFLVETKSGYKGIFRRVGKKRLPLKQLHGPSIPQVAERNSVVRNVMNTEAGEIYLANALKRTQFLLERV